MTWTLPELEEEGLTLKGVPADAGPIVIEWHGKANARRPAEVLDPYFGRLLEAAQASGRPLCFDFQQLRHFNSSTIVVLMQFIKRLEQQHVELTLRYDVRQKWQKMTFEALRQFEGPGRVLRLQGIG